jgi:hypothetical protein
MHRLQHATANRGARFTRQVAPFRARRRRRASALKLGSTSRRCLAHSATQANLADRAVSRAASKSKTVVDLPASSVTR